MEELKKPIVKKRLDPEKRDASEIHEYFIDENIKH